MFDACEIIRALQEVVRLRDRAYLRFAVSDCIIWVTPQSDNKRGKTDWIDASCSVTWNWFKITIRAGSRHR